MMIAGGCFMVPQPAFELWSAGLSWFFSFAKRRVDHDSISVIIGDDFYKTLNQPWGFANPQDVGSSDKRTQLGCHCGGGDVDVPWCFRSCSRLHTRMDKPWFQGFFIDAMLAPMPVTNIFGHDIHSQSNTMNCHDQPLLAINQPSINHH